MRGVFSAKKDNEREGVSCAGKQRERSREAAYYLLQENSQQAFMSPMAVTLWGQEWNSMHTDTSANCSAAVTLHE